MRTDLTRLCPHCAVRMSPAERCRRCQAACLIDLENASVQASALTALRRNGPRGRRLADLVQRIPLLRKVTIGVFVGMGLLAAVLLPARIHAGVALVVAGFVVGSAAAVLVRVAIEEAHERHREHGHVPVGILDAPENTRRTQLRGRVRASDTVLSPLRRVPCAAFRLVGRAGDHLVDDAGGCAFDVVDSRGDAQRVDLESACLEIDPPHPPSGVEVKQPVRDFLASRLVEIPLRARLEEAVLLDGDEVVVEGSIEDVLQPALYRGEVRTRVLRDVRIRRA